MKSNLVSEIKQGPHFLDVVLDGSSGEDDPVSRRYRPDALTTKTKKAALTLTANRNQYSTLRGKTDKLEEAVNRELNVTRS